METETTLALEESVEALTDEQFLELFPEPQQTVIKRVASERDISYYEAFQILWAEEVRENIADRSQH